jgi:hypothetical protein
MDEPGSVAVNQALRQELLALVEQDHAFVCAPEHDPNSDQVQRQRLALLGRLTRRLVEILDTYGWPGKRLVGDDGAEAAWMLALHTMHDPEVLRLLRAAAAAGEAEPVQVAFLVDRLSLVERNVQVYGTTICRQADGALVRPCWRIPTRWTSAVALSAFHPWNKTFAGLQPSTAAATSSSVRSLIPGLRAEPLTLRLGR